MSIYFGWNMNGVIHVNPSRTIGIIIPKIISLNSGTGIGFECNIGDVIPQRNSGDLTSLTEGRRIFPTGARCVMAQRKVK